MADHDVVTNPKRAVLHQHGGHRAASLLEVRVDHSASRQLGRVGLEILQVGDQQDHLEHLRDARLLLRGYRNHDGLPTPVFGDQALLGEALLDPVGVGAFLVDLVDGDHDRHLRGLGVRNRLDGLRHDAVIRRDDEHGDVGDLGAARAHRGKRLVAWRVQEDDAPALLLDDVGTDALRDATGLARRHLGLTDGVEQRRLAVVDVTHDGDYGRAGLQVLRRFAVVAEELGPGGQLDLGALALPDDLLGDCRVHGHRTGLHPKAVRHDRGGIEIDLLIDIRHHAVLHQLFDDVDRLDVEILGQLLHRQGWRQFDLSLGRDRLALRRLAGTRRELGADRRLLVRREHRHGMPGRVPLRAQEIQDVPGLDAEVTGELLNLDAASRCRYG